MDASAPATPPQPAPVTPTWRLRALALCSGLLYAFSHPFAWPGSNDGVTASLTRPAWVLAFVCLVPLLVAVRHMTPRVAYFFSAWAIIPGIFITIYWLMIAMNVFGGIPVVFSALLLLLLCTVGWQYLGIAVGVARWLEVRRGWPSWFTVPACWTGMELCRAHVYFGGFPWANLGTAQFNNLLIMQLGALGGVYLIIAVVALVNVALFEGVRVWLGERALPLPLWSATAGVVALSLGWGAWHIHALDAESAAAPRIKVGMLQGNIEQGIKNKDMQHQEHIIQKYARLQQDALDRGAELIIWPEGALPAYLGPRDVTMEGRRLPSLGQAYGVVGTAVLGRDPPTLTGDACRVSPVPRECKGTPWLHNSAVVVDPGQRILGRFDKTHLVPFGEYVPWPLGLVARAIVPGIASYRPGESLTPVAVQAASGQHQVGALVCYEGCFPQYARIFSANGAGLLINVTNDAWYGISSAGPQHLAFYALRAAENGRALARVANTGITAGVDPVGRILEPTPLYEEAALVMDLPILTGRTFYNLTGDVFAYVATLVFLFGLGGGLKEWYLARRGRKKQPAPPH
jgi:apolipoprotein N-acyltransferase